MSLSQGESWLVNASVSQQYDIVTTPDVFNCFNNSLLSVGRLDEGRRFVVVDDNVYAFHGERIHNYFKHNNIEAHIVRLAAGEANKSVSNWLAVLRELDNFPLRRRDEPIIAIGGGVVTDLVGFVASCYRRGIPHIMVPTTLMGCVDAAVGIKTGINFNNAKNRLGSFAPPARVLLDLSLLSTLPLRHLKNGVCEILKLAIIKDGALFSQLESVGFKCLASAFQDLRGEHILQSAIADMLEELEPNLYEKELARCVDFGHTFSYGLEARFPETLLHGEAVLLDMLICIQIAYQRKVLSAFDVAHINRLLVKLSLAPSVDLLDARLMWHTLKDRVMHRNGKQHVPLPNAIGSHLFVNDICYQGLEKAVMSLRQYKLPGNGYQQELVG